MGANLKLNMIPIYLVGAVWHSTILFSFQSARGAWNKLNRVSETILPTDILFSWVGFLKKNDEESDKKGIQGYSSHHTSMFIWSPHRCLQRVHDVFTHNKLFMHTIMKIKPRNVNFM